MRNRSVRRSSFTTSVMLLFKIGLRGTKQGMSMKKPAFFMAKPNVSVIFYIAFSVCIIFLTLSKYKQNAFYFWRPLFKRISMTTWEYVYSFKISIFFPVNVSREVIVSSLSLGNRALFFLAGIFSIYLVVMQSEMTRIVSSEIRFLRRT